MPLTLCRSILIASLVVTASCRQHPTTDLGPTTILPATSRNAFEAMFTTRASLAMTVGRSVRP